MHIRKKKDGLNFPIRIAETGGTEKFDIIPFIYYNSADGIILMYNIDNKSSFDYVVRLLNLNQKFLSNNRKCLLIGNKVNKE